MAKHLKSGKYRADKIRFPDGVGCCIWLPFSKKKGDEEVGLCFDFAEKDIPDLISLLEKLKVAKAVEFEE